MSELTLVANGSYNVFDWKIVSGFNNSGAKARRGARLSRVERVADLVTDPCEPDLGNASVGKRRQPYCRSG